jgi:8-oxo-dGTP diphosphatase
VDGIAVAAAVIIRGGRVLLARRRPEKARGGLWEFPGGKVEAGEAPEQALVREMAEEFCCRISVESFLGAETHDYPDLRVRILAFLAQLESTITCMTDHDARAWMSAAELKQAAESTFENKPKAQGLPGRPPGPVNGAFEGVADVSGSAAGSSAAVNRLLAPADRFLAPLVDSQLDSGL